MSISDELAKLQELRRTGVVDDAEFKAAKARILREDEPRPAASSGYARSEQSLADETRTWAILLHISQFAGYVVPMAGFIVPIVLWLVKKNELPGIDDHGKVVVNWIISEFIYAIVSALLIIAVIGIPMLIAVIIVSIVFPIIGAVKAANDEVWRYPLSIQFFK